MMKEMRKLQKDEQMAIDDVEKELGVNIPLILV